MTGAPDVEIHWHEAPREELLELFTLAEDSRGQLDRYLSLGRVLTAVERGAPVGYVQLVECKAPEEIDATPSRHPRATRRGL